jgi:methylenetetrahydrofolate reductase (NADPH)
MKKITELLNEGFTHSVELVPPRNCSETNALFEKLSELSAIKPTFMSVTKGAGGSLRGGTLPLAYFAHAKYNIPSIAHFTCREINRYEVENQLVDQNYFGIKNILALRGDPPFGAKENDWTGEYSYAYQLVEQIRLANEGKYLSRPGVDKAHQGYHEGAKAGFCIGVAAHPQEAPGKRTTYLKRKADAGADFAITQMVFDAERYEEFVEEARGVGIKIPIIAGVLPMDSKKKLIMAEKEFGVPVPGSFSEGLLEIEDDEEFRKKGLNATVSLCRKLKEKGAPGVHLFVFQNTKSAKEIFGKLRPD